MKKEKEEQLWLKFCKAVKVELNKITEPVIDENNRSYEALSDVITNVILFELSIDRKPWKKIPKREVQIPSKEELENEILERVSLEKMAKTMSDRISSSISYNDCGIEEVDNNTLKLFLLYSLLKDIKFKNLINY